MGLSEIYRKIISMQIFLNMMLSLKYKLDIIMTINLVGKNCFLEPTFGVSFFLQNLFFTGANKANWLPQDLIKFP